MRILILGGTIFVGRHLVADALKKNHDVTLFHRGKHNPGLFGGAVETITGDRAVADDLAKLANGREWDAVIDTCGYVPRIVRMSADVLKDSTRTYCFISTVSVYADWSVNDVNEDSALATLTDPATEEVTGETYGGLKALCERAVRDVCGDSRTLIVRPGYIVGPHDPSDRFTYWPHRVARGGDILAPGDENTAAQFVDVRDLAEWNLRLLEGGVTGTFNADGLPVRFAELLPACRTAAGLTEAAARFVYVPEPFLSEQGVESWQMLPIFTPKAAEDAGCVDVSRAVASGLTFRPLAETVADTLAWDKTRTEDANTYKNTLTADREYSLLAAFRNTENR
ncbi:MAG: NAD-dependent epimerase/dehydratase family protein [Akkermansiaceae bacterium]|nr:NAD-dependent epimerase/dehydratase family protein [Armatimonadota bacterium]